MTRQTRLVLVLGLIALAGVIALGLLAQRLQRVAEMRSVHELEPAQRERLVSGPVAGPAAPEGAASQDGPPAEPPVTASDTADPKPTEIAAAPEGVADEVWRKVDAFIAVRARVKTMVETEGKPRWIDDDTGLLRDDLNYRDHKHITRLTTRVKLLKVEELQKLGLTEADYDVVRDGFRNWLNGGEVDVELTRAFEERRDELNSLLLDTMERFDG